MRLDEHQRDTILREMGIQTYVPRQPLPGARASVPALARATPLTTRERAMPVAVPVAAAASGEIAPAPVKTPAQPAASGIAAALAPAAPARRAASAGQTPAPAPAVQSADAAEAARFAFAYIPVNEQLAVINELPWARAASLSPSCRQLLADMLKALGVACEPGGLSPMVFTWPLSDAGDMPVDAENARHMLEGFLSRRLKLRPVRYLMVLAEQSAGYLFPAQTPWQANAESLMQHPRFPVELVVTHSLNAMEAVRELKRPAWQALQPLKQALAQSRPQDTAQV